MGCDYYELSDKHFARFSEAAEDVACLCTWPRNHGHTIEPDTLRSLAMLGAAVVLYHQGAIEDNVFLPFDLPEWVVEAIKAGVRE